MTRFCETIAQITADTVVAQNADWLASDFRVTRQDSVVRISVCTSSAVRARLVPSTGSAFALRGGSTLSAAAVYTEEVVLDTSRTWNLATDDAAGTTVRHLVVQEVVR